jgi:preprotein translocase SecE subunit
MKKVTRFLKIVLRPFGFLKPIGRYFVGSWRELREVRWPNRKATWVLTLTVLGYSAFFVVLILLLDLGFKTMFDLILK